MGVKVITPDTPGFRFEDLKDEIDTLIGFARIHLGRAPTQAPRPRAIDPDTLYDVSQVCTLVGLKKSAVYRLMQAGELPRTRVGHGRYGSRVLGRDLLDYLEANKGGLPTRGTFKHLRL